MLALITGASSGIGRDMARVLSQKYHCDLILVARRVDRMQTLKEELPTRVQVIGCDLSKEESCFALYQKVKDRNIDILINNAGFGIFGAFDETDLQRELQMIDTNIRAVHILTKLFLKDFVKRDSGYFLNVASSAAFLPGPLLSSYYASKAYVLRLSQAIQEELRRKGSHVSVSVLCPGPVRTEFDEVADVRFSMKGLESRTVAAYAVQQMFARKKVIVPGYTMKCAKFWERFVPDTALLRISYHMQKRKREHS